MKLIFLSKLQTRQDAIITVKQTIDYNFENDAK
jgi:hypothetical protein